jgi:hypothetical protein
MSCKGKQNYGSNGRGGVSWKYWEVSERQEKGYIITVEVGLHYRGQVWQCLGGQYKHEALVYIVFYHWGKFISHGNES